MRALQYIQSQPWMILPDFLDLMVEIASRERTPEEVARGIEQARALAIERENSPAALAIRQGEPLGDNKRVRVRQGVGVISVIGPIVRHADFFSDISGGTSTERLARDFGQADNAPEVSSIALFVDSPGGEAFGIPEMAKLISEAKKPVVAYVGGYGASAAYYLASAADEIVIDSGALLGSIGTVMGATDYSKAYEQRGIRKREYVSKQSPRKRPKMDTESGDAQFQEIVDDLAQVFVEDVARFRGVSVEKVLNDFGRGGLLAGQKAVQAGLADRLGSFEGLLNEMTLGYKRKRRMKSVAEIETAKPETGANSGGEKMSLWDQLKAALSGEQPKAEAAGHVPDKPTTVQPPAAAAQASADEESEQMKQLRAQIETERNARIRSEAVAFAEGEIIAHRALPAEKDTIVSLFTQAALDDASHPAKVAFVAITAGADGKPVKEAKEGTRVEALRATYAARPAHNLTREMVAFDETGMRALSNDAGSKDDIKKAEESARAYAKEQNRAGTSSKAVN